MTSRARITAVMEGLVYVSMLDKGTGWTLKRFKRWLIWSMGRPTGPIYPIILHTYVGDLDSPPSINQQDFFLGKETNKTCIYHRKRFWIALSLSLFRVWERFSGPKKSPIYTHIAPNDFFIFFISFVLFFLATFWILPNETWGSHFFAHYCYVHTYM